ARVEELEADEDYNSGTVRFLRRGGEGPAAAAYGAARVEELEADEDYNSGTVRFLRRGGEGPAAAAYG
ncbi:hypothetical protein C0U44_32745, partial [Klebsiella pneumoniae]